MKKNLKILHSALKGIIWNCRGAKSRETILEMKRLVREHQTDFVFLSETKSSQKYCQILAKKLKFSKFDGFPAIGNAGGISLFWNDTTKFCIISKDKSYLHCEFECDEPYGNWVASYNQVPPYAQ